MPLPDLFPFPRLPLSLRGPCGLGHRAGTTLSLLPRGLGSLRGQLYSSGSFVSQTF